MGKNTSVYPCKLPAIDWHCILHWCLLVLCVLGANLLVLLSVLRPSQFMSTETMVEPRTDPPRHWVGRRCIMLSLTKPGIGEFHDFLCFLRTASYPKLTPTAGKSHGVSATMRLPSTTLSRIQHLQGNCIVQHIKLEDVGCGEQAITKILSDHHIQSCQRDIKHSRN